MTQTGEVNLESKQKTGESSERSQEAINPARVPPITDIVNPSPNFGNRLQGNLIDSTSVSCMLRECMIKFRSSLKSQSHLSLFLVIIFAVIFFMQVRTSTPECQNLFCLSLLGFNKIYIHSIEDFSLKIVACQLHLSELPRTLCSVAAV